MSHYTLENHELRLVVSSLGAEMQSVFLKSAQLETLWQGQADIWPRRAPWLFPIIGKLQGDQYQISGQTFTMKQHGFARDREFSLLHQDEKNLSFSLNSDAQTRQNYPYDFNLQISYQLKGRNIKITIKVQNQGEGPLPFSFGAHPGFTVSPGAKVILADEEASYFEFSDGQEPKQNSPQLCQSSRFVLNQDLQNQKARVFKKQRSQSLEYHHEAYKLKMEFKHWPHFALWSKSQNHFICLEPWCGLPQILEGKLNPPPSPFEYQLDKVWERELLLSF